MLLKSITMTIKLSEKMESLLKISSVILIFIVYSSCDVTQVKSKEKLPAKEIEELRIDKKFRGKWRVVDVLEIPRAKPGFFNISKKEAERYRGSFIFIARGVYKDLDGSCELKDIENLRLSVFDYMEYSRTAAYPPVRCKIDIDTIEVVRPYCANRIDALDIFELKGVFYADLGSVWLVLDKESEFK